MLHFVGGQEGIAAGIQRLLRSTSGAKRELAFEQHNALIRLVRVRCEGVACGVSHQQLDATGLLIFAEHDRFGTRRIAFLMHPLGAVAIDDDGLRLCLTERNRDGEREDS